MDLIKLLEELGKFSISSMELKNVMWLLREEENFDYRKQLLQVNFICDIGELLKEHTENGRNKNVIDS